MPSNYSTAEANKILEDLGNQLGTIFSTLSQRTKNVEQPLMDLQVLFDNIDSSAEELAKGSLWQLRTALANLKQVGTADNLNKVYDALRLLDAEGQEHAAKQRALQEQKESAEEERLRKEMERRTAPGGVGAAGAVIGGGAAGAIGGAIGGLLGPIQALTGAVAPFVAALNPSLMQLFNFNLRNLMATIGVGLQPVMQVLSLTVKQLAITLFPAMQALAPIMGNLANILVGNLIPYIGILADLFVTLAPVIEFLTDIFSQLADVQRVVMTVWRTVFQTLLQVLSEWLGAVTGINLKDVSKQIQEVLQTVVKYFVTFAAYLAKFLGSLGLNNNFIDNLIKNLSTLQGQGKQAYAAASGATNKSFEQIGSDIAKAAFIAQEGGTGKQKDQLDFLKELTDSLKDIQQNNKTLRDWLDELLRDVFNTSIDKILVWLGEHLPNPPTLEEAKEKVREVLNANPKTSGFTFGATGDFLLNQLGL